MATQALALVLLLRFFSAVSAAVDPAASLRLSKERAVLQTTFGDMQLAFYPDVRPR